VFVIGFASHHSPRTLRHSANLRFFTGAATLVGTLPGLYAVTRFRKIRELCGSSSRLFRTMGLPVFFFKRTFNICPLTPLPPRSPSQNRAAFETISVPVLQTPKRPLSSLNNPLIFLASGCPPLVLFPSIGRFRPPPGASLDEYSFRSFFATSTSARSAD